MASLLSLSPLSPLMAITATIGNPLLVAIMLHSPQRRPLPSSSCYLVLLSSASRPPSAQVLTMICSLAAIVASIRMLLCSRSLLHHGPHHGPRHGLLLPHGRLLGCLLGLQARFQCRSRVQSSPISKIMSESPTAPSMMSPTDESAYITIIHNAAHWLSIQRRAYISTTGHRHKDPIG